MREKKVWSVEGQLPGMEIGDTCGGTFKGGRKPHLPMIRRWNSLRVKGGLNSAGGRGGREECLSGVRTRLRNFTASGGRLQVYRGERCRRKGRAKKGAWSRLS